jgi:hypothetical protein
MQTGTVERRFPVNYNEMNQKPNLCFTGFAFLIFQRYTPSLHEYSPEVIEWMEDIVKFYKSYSIKEM